MNLRFVDLRLGDFLAVMLSGQVSARPRKTGQSPRRAAKIAVRGAATMRRQFVFAPAQQFPRATGFSTDLCFLMEPDQPGSSVSTGVVASAGWKTRIVTLDQSPWQTCRRRDSDSGDHFVALGGQVKMPGGQVDRFQQVGFWRRTAEVQVGNQHRQSLCPAPRYPAEK